MMVERNKNIADRLVSVVIGQQGKTRVVDRGDHESVIDARNKVVLGEHNSLGKACCARCVNKKLQLIRITLLGKKRRRVKLGALFKCL